ncbi:MAG: HEAT repeat domain-containing protein [bacterium]
MIPQAAGRSVEQLLFLAFGITCVLWLGASIFVLLNRMLYDRTGGRLRMLARRMTTDEVLRLAPDERLAAVRGILVRLSRREVYRVTADTELPAWLTALCATYSLDRWGLAQIVRDAASHRRGRKWRRIAALFTLGELRTEGVHELLEQAVRDPDPDVAGAAVTVLRRLEDRRAAGILITALREESYPPSRIATQLDQFAIPIDDLLLPLLADPRPNARYWGASLLGHYPGFLGVAERVAALEKDEYPGARKTAVTTLARMDVVIALPVAIRLLADPVPYVRAAAIRTVAARGAQAHEESVRRDLAARLTPALADRDWDVRFAAKESLEHLGPGVWREVAEALESADAFARNGAAEVLQNTGVLDRVIAEMGTDTPPDALAMRVLERALNEGGAGMVDAAVARRPAGVPPALVALLERLRFTGPVLA